MKAPAELTKRQIRRRLRLADVAEMYFVKKMTQKQISEVIGTTPSNVSRMIADAEEAGVVQITINRPTSNDPALEAKLKAALGLKAAHVVAADDRNPEHLAQQVARAGSELLRRLLNPGMTLGVTWGRTLLAMIDTFGDPVAIEGKVIQLAGSIGAHEAQFDSVSLVQRLGGLTQSRTVHLNAPFVVEDARIAASLRRNHSNRESSQLATECDLIVVGIGSTDRKQSSLFASGFLSEAEIDEIIEAGAIGEICGHPIDARGRPVAPDFSSRVVTIGLAELARTKVKLAVAARPHLARTIIGASMADCMSHLVTDVATAKEVVQLID